MNDTRFEGDVRVEKYWVTFRLADDDGYSKRYDALLKALVKVRTSSWGEPTSFWLIETALSIDALGKALTAGLDPRKDLLAIRALAKDSSRYFGSFKHLNVFKGFLPNATKLP